MALAWTGFVICPAHLFVDTKGHLRSKPIPGVRSPGTALPLRAGVFGGHPFRPRRKVRGVCPGEPASPKLGSRATYGGTWLLQYISEIYDTYVTHYLPCQTKRYGLLSTHCRHACNRLLPGGRVHVRCRPGTLRADESQPHRPAARTGGRNDLERGHRNSAHVYSITRAQRVGAACFFGELSFLFFLRGCPN